MVELQRLLFLQERKSRQTLQDRRSHPPLPTHSGELSFRILYWNMLSEFPPYILLL